MMHFACDRLYARIAFGSDEQIGDLYERELKGILGGEEKFLSKLTKNLPYEQRNAYLKLRQKHFLVVKAAGSFGIDLLAVRGNFAFPIEVKSSAADVFRFSKSEKLAEQASRMRLICEHSALVPTYAYRLKNCRGGSVETLHHRKQRSEPQRHPGTPLPQASESRNNAGWQWNSKVE